MKAPSGAARAEVVPTELLDQLLVSAHDADAALDARLGREASTALARPLERKRIRRAGADAGCGVAWRPPFSGGDPTRIRPHESTVRSQLCWTLPSTCAATRHDDDGSFRTLQSEQARYAVERDGALRIDFQGMDLSLIGGIDGQGRHAVLGGSPVELSILSFVMLAREP